MTDEGGDICGLAFEEIKKTREGLMRQVTLFSGQDGPYRKDHPPKTLKAQQQEQRSGYTRLLLQMGS